MAKIPYPSAQKDPGSAPLARPPHSAKIVSSVAITTPKDAFLSLAPPSDAKNNRSSWRSAVRSWDWPGIRTETRRSCSHFDRVHKYSPHVDGDLGVSTAPTMPVTSAGIASLFGSDQESTGTASVGSVAAVVSGDVSKARIGCLGRRWFFFARWVVNVTPSLVSANSEFVAAE
jgi:hypothetical protein